MDFELSEAHKMLAESVYDFMLREIDPIAEQIDREDKLPDWVWKKLGGLGWMGVTVPEKYGGSGMDYLAQCICLEQMSRICPALSLSCHAHSNLCCDNLNRNGNEAQRQKYLPPLCRGEKLGALALTEPNAGSDAVGIQMRAKRDGKYFVLSGTKTFITNGPVAGAMILYAKTDPEKGAKGITAFIVEPGYQGTFTVRHLEKMGERGSPTGELIFDDYRVPEENILGGLNQGVSVMMGGLDMERVAGTGWTLGMGERALELSLKYAKERVQFGQPIGQFQLIQEKLVDMYVGIESAKLLMYKAATMAQSADRGGKGSEINKVAAAALLLAGQVATQAVLHAVQIHGGYSYMLDYPVNRLLRDVKLGEIGAGTTEMRKIIIARELLRG
ncbi:MAG TPA: acyl-CoA dehydrogenase family protein [Dehalococcoidia bacterium]|nr:acyl-CoA dehydrogenase family protein [Dehalococcoidia bacterium]